MSKKTTVPELKVFDRAKSLSEKLRDTSFRTYENVQKEKDEKKPEEQAQRKIQTAMRRAARLTLHRKSGTGVVSGVLTLLFSGKEEKSPERKSKSAVRRSEVSESQMALRSLSVFSERTDNPVSEAEKPEKEVFEFKTRKTTFKTADKSVKAAEHTQAAQRTAAVNKAVTDSHKAEQAARQAAVETRRSLVASVEATIKAIKGIKQKTKDTTTAIAAGGALSAAIVIFICVIGLILGSGFGIFFSGYDTGSGMTMRSAINTINAEYQTKLNELQSGIAHDALTTTGARPNWADVLAVYAVKTSDDMNVASMDEEHLAKLREVFWDMTEFETRTETVEETITVESSDENGNIVETRKTVKVKRLYITVTGLTADELAERYRFTDSQKAQLQELLSDNNKSLWAQVMFGYTGAGEDIVIVALGQLGNRGGEPFWSWYGFQSRVSWCACFVSWCADQCGYLDIGVLPRFASCSVGVEWFKAHSQWQDNSYIPNPGDLIFFDWYVNGVGQDGSPDHVGIVERVEGDVIYTVEGNTSDSCAERSYAVGWYEVYGFGVLVI